jgi:hypothetical protein
MSDDLVKELRFWNGGHKSDEKMAKAANRIEQLEAALRLYAGFESNGIKWEPIDDRGGVARAALGEKKND